METQRHDQDENHIGPSESEAPAAAVSSQLPSGPLGLSLHLDFPQLPHNVAEACEPRQPRAIQNLKVLRVHLATAKSFNCLGDL